MKKILFIAIAMIVMLFCGQSFAVDVTFTWDANSEPVAGCRIFCREDGQNYNTPAWDGSGITCTISDLPEGIKFYFVARAYDTYNAESVNSNEVWIYSNIFNESSSENFSCSSEGTMDPANSVITVEVASAPSNIKNVYWANNNITVAEGEMLTVNFNASVIGSEKTPISIYLEDAATGIWTSQERVIYLTSTPQDYEIKLNNKITCENAKLMVVCGHEAVDYQFSNISITIVDPTLKPIKAIFLWSLGAP